jgi:hypothetical protein
LSKLKASALKLTLSSGANGRQALITCQIALSIGLIMCAVMVHKQYKYALNYDLGYDTENIVNINIHGHYIDALENEYAKIAEVVQTSRSSMVLGTGNMTPADAKSEDRSDTIMFSCSYIDSKYLEMHGFKLVAGTGFLAPLKDGQMQNTIIVNEGFLKELELGTPEEAIGKQIWYFDEVRLEIQGVVRDFVSKSLDTEAPRAFGFLHGVTDENTVVGVKIVSTDFPATMEKLETIYKKLDPVHPFQAMFYDDQIARTYEDSKATYTIISFLALLAITISTLGLLGIAVFTIEMKVKEICIRKILGARLSNLMLLLSRNLFVMIATAATIAIPASLYIVDDLILNQFLYKTETGLVEILSGLLVVLLIGIFTIGWQVRTAATQNPSDLLRAE